MADIRELFIESSSAYDDRDVDKMMSYVTEDYTWYNIDAQGPQKLAVGREQAAQGLNMVFASPKYVSGRVEYAKAFGHIVVALEVDTYNEGGQEIQRSRLGVYEYLEDKLQRAWSFPVADQDTK